MLEDILSNDAIINSVLTLFGAILTYVITRAAGAFQMATGIEVEAKHREALHSAILTGVRSAVQHGPKKGMEDIKALAIAHVRQSVPDAVAALVPGDSVLDRLVERYAMQQLDRVLGE
jgi:hypothetical protein